MLENYVLSLQNMNEYFVFKLKPFIINRIN